MFKSGQERKRGYPDRNGRTNVPQNIRYAIRDLAKYMKVSEDTLTEHARENAERIFRLTQKLE